MNKVILSGRLTRDPQVKNFGAASKTCVRFTVAVERKYRQDTADFVNCVAFGSTADFIRDYMAQGTKIMLEGRWQTNSYTAADGSKKHSDECVVDSVEFCESKKHEPELETEAGSPFAQMEIDLDDAGLPFN